MLQNNYYTSATADAAAAVSDMQSNRSSGSNLLETIFSKFLYK